MDNLSYTYYPGTNRLSGVTDAVAAGQFAGDVDSQVANNYAYDGSGNLNQDLQSGIARNGIKWSPYGKVLSVNRGSGNLTNFSYDASQYRIRKQQVTATTDTSTYYIRDAQGNVLAVYRQYGTTVAWQEQHLYGSSRLGSLEPGVSWTTAPAATPYFRATPTLRLGWKRYELSDHLGNVRAIINDRRTYNTAGLYYSAAVLNGTDYFPFGSEMRSSRLANYRFGFNGKELDKSQEFGILNVYDYGFRIYNPGIGRFLSVDPLIQKYPELTPYQFASNTPIQAIDLDGGEVMKVPNSNEGNVRNYNLFDGNAYAPAKIVTYIYHTGSPQKQAGWYTSTDYYSYLSEVAYEHGRVDAIRSNTRRPLSKFTAPFQFDKYFNSQNIDDNWVKGYGHLYSSAYSEGYKNGLNSGTGQIITNDIDFEIISILSGLELASFARWGIKKGVTVADDIAEEVVEEGLKKGVRNGHLAGKFHPKTNVPFDEHGFPDFSKNLYPGGKNDVIIKPTGNRTKDFAAANKAAGYNKTPEDYTWHHHQSTGRMQLVETEAHSKTAHTGGFALWKY